MAAAFQRGLVRLYDRDGRWYRRSLGASERPELVPALDAWVRGLRAARRFDVLDALIARRLSPLDAFLAEVDGTLPARLAAVQADAAQAAETDLSPLVETLVRDPRYRRQIRRLIPGDTRFPVSRFTTATVAAFLRTLTADRRSADVEAPARPVRATTKDRYRAALSHFARQLVEHGYLTSNPVRDVTGERKPRRPIRFLEPDQVRTLVDALPSPYRALEALLAGTGMELSAALGLRRRDVDTATRILFAQGQKNSYRTRYVEVSEDWCWQIIAAHVKALAPAALLFPGVREDVALRVHHRTAEAAGLPRTTLHQHRHSYAVMHLRRGSDHQWLKTQLGHAPQSTLLYTTYGVWIGGAKLTAAQRARLGDTRQGAEANSRSVTSSVTAGEK